MLIITFLIKPFQLATLYVVLFLYFLAKKDYATMYIEKYWIFPSILLLCFCSTYVPLFNRVCTSLVFLLVSGTIKIIRTEWIGSADVCFFTFFGFYLGMERMLVALYISVLLGFLWIVYKKKHILPYLSCLSIGVWIAYLKGYTIFYFLIDTFNKLGYKAKINTHTTSYIN